MNKKLINKAAKKYHPDKIVTLTPTTSINTALSNQNAFIEGAKYYKKHSKKSFNSKKACDLIQYLAQDVEFNGYSSVSKSCSLYFLRKYIDFKINKNKIK